MTLDTGTQIGEYRVDGLLGQGGMAEVYKAWQVNLQRYEALKVLSPRMADDPAFVERFLKEARTAANLQHTNIAAIHTVSSAGAPQPFFTMELLSGGDLSDLIADKKRLTLDEALPILQQIASALDFAHSHGLIHRDIKPANILLKPEGNGFTVKVVDFGISKAIEDTGGTRLTQTGMIIGTPEYMSPEQAGSGEKVDQRTDQYSLAVVAYEMLCGVTPFRSETDTSMMSVLMKHVRDEPLPPLQLNASLPLSANAAILKALAKNPVDRFDSCGQFVEAMEATVPVSCATHNPTVIVDTIVHPKSTFPLIPVALFLILIAGAGMIGYGFNRGRVRQNNNGSGTISNAGDSSSSADTNPTESVHDVTRFTNTSATASKAMKAKGYDYSPSMVLDGRSDTAWNVENQYHGKGEWIMISWPTERVVKRIGVIVGYNKHNYKPDYAGQPQMWFRNNRLRTATLYFSNGEHHEVTFDDKTGVQMRNFPGIRSKWIKLVVRDVYLDMYGGKQKRWDDLAIAEIQVWGEAG